ncbi:hypothetical protein GGQ92_000036 [Gracilibacillus halotolerans]|uniref:Uncharacterized protein n=1 Tax=Gracilibacillus halotolerans TaxID=74386 RepID=A0A841RFN6_9BACI|nr:hypothetical protein [Gracilibacillus halotolerans]
MRKFFSVVSTSFFLFSFFMIMHMSVGWNIAFIEYLYRVSIFTPLILNVLGLLSAYFSTKGTTRKTLFFINSMLIIYFGILIFIASVGFQEP